MLPSVPQLLDFLAVAEEGQFTRAAERLQVAQPSVSAQIRRLEASLRTPLFHRGPGPVTLTDAGTALLPIARRVVADLASINDELSGLDELLRGRAAVGATPSLSATLLPSILGRFHRLYPGVVIRVSEQGSPQLLEELLEGTLDLVLAIAPIATKGLASVPLAEEELVVVTPPDHPLAGRSSVTVPELGAHPLVMFRPGYDLRTSTIDAFSAHGLEPVVAVEGGEMGSVLASGGGRSRGSRRARHRDDGDRPTASREVPTTGTDADDRPRAPRRPGPFPSRRGACLRLHRGDRVGWLAGTDAPGDAVAPVRAGNPCPQTRSRPRSRPRRLTP